MAFPRDEVAELLVACHRRCCICHRFCGFKIGLPDRDMGCPLPSARFDDALANGAISLMPDDLKAKVYNAYAAIKRADTFVRAVPGFAHGSDPWATAHNRAREAIRMAASDIATALNALRVRISAIVITQIARS